MEMVEEEAKGCVACAPLQEFGKLWFDVVLFAVGEGYVTQKIVFFFGWQCTGRTWLEGWIGFLLLVDERCLFFVIFYQLLIVILSPPAFRKGGGGGSGILSIRGCTRCFADTTRNLHVRSCSTLANNVGWAHDGLS
jgi:hypothetical protein